MQIRTLPADMVVFGAGIRPNDELATPTWHCERGGILINDGATPPTSTFGLSVEVACVLGRT